MSFVIETDNTDHSYTIEYTIDGGKKQSISPILPNTRFNLDYEFYALTEYGGHAVKGVVFDNDDALEKSSFDKKVWMKYLTASKSNPYLITHLGTRIESSDGNIVAPTNNDGLLCFDYTPMETAVLCTIESSNPSIIDFNTEEIVCQDGVWKVPYHTSSKQGGSVVKMFFTNGDEQSEATCGIATSAEKEETDIDAELRVQPFVIEGYYPYASIKVKSGPEFCSYDAEFYIDDVLVKKRTGIALGVEVSESFVPVIIGEHELRAVITGTAGYNNTITLSSSFMVAPVTVSISNANDTEDRKEFNFDSQEHLSFYIQNTYNVKLYGVPVEYLSLFALSCNKSGMDKITRNTNGWSVSPTSIGEAKLTLSLIDHPDVKCSFANTQYENVDIRITRRKKSDITISLSNEKRISDIAFRIHIKYHGELEYPNTHPDGSYHGSVKCKTSEAVLDEDAIILKDKQDPSTLIHGLSNAVNGIESQYEDYTYYSDEGRGYIEWTYERAYYDFIFDEFNIDVYQYKLNDQDAMSNFSKYHIVTVNEVDGINATIHQDK